MSFSLVDGDNTSLTLFFLIKLENDFLPMPVLLLVLLGIPWIVPALIQVSTCSPIMTTVPQNFPSHISQKHFKKDPQVAQGSPRVDQTSSLLRQSTSNQGFGSFKEFGVFNDSIKSHRPIYILKHLHAKFQNSQCKFAQSKTLIAQQSTAGAKWSFDSQKSKFLVNILF